MSLGALALGHRTVAAASGGPDISLSIDVDGGGDDCDTRPATSAGATCTVFTGQQFVVKGNVDSAAGLPDTDGDTQHGYAGFQFRLLRSPGLTLNNPPGTETELGFPGPFWPPCGSGRGDSEVGPTYDIVCFSSGGESLFLGKVVEVTYTCSSPGVQSVTMDDAGSYIHNDGHGNLPLDKGGGEVLTINCTGGTVGGIAQPASVLPRARMAGTGEQPDTGAPLQTLTGRSGVSAGVILAIAGSVVATSLAALWYAKRSLYRSER
jgi:hypothetical protein